MNLITRILILASLTVWAGACDRSTRRAITQAPKNVLQEPKLQGTFESTCHSVDLDALHGALDGSQQTSMRFVGGKFTRINRIFSEEKCVKPALEFLYEGDFEVDADAVQGSPGAIRIRLNQAKVKPVTEDAAKILNKIKFCGVENYQPGREQTVNGARALCPFESLPQTYYGAYQVQGNELILDHPDITSMAKSRDKRDTNLKKDSPYKKK